MKNIVRVRSVELSGFKNVVYGKIEMPSVRKKVFFQDASEILGIYGQNGSGKTAIVNAMEVIQQLLTGRAIPSSFVHYIRRESQRCRLRIGFTLETEERFVLVDYAVAFRLKNRDFEICEESVYASERMNGVYSKRHKLLGYDLDSEEPLLPIFRQQELVKSDPTKKVTLLVTKAISNKERSSLFFSEGGRELFADKENPATEDYAYIINSLHEYAIWNLFVITSGHTAPISSSFLLPLSFKFQHKNVHAKGDLPIRLDEPSIVSEEEHHMGKQIIEDINVVLCSLIPGLSIEIFEHGKQMKEDGEEGYRIELFSKRGESRIPLRCESEGIIKIISILNVLICVYNSPGMCLVIDELDAGIFEFLLGELMLVMSQGAKGQVIFTSHNLRVLEMIDKGNLVFSTTNPLNRYVPITNIKKNNNLRDVYLRSLTLGGQRESLYAETDRVEIGKAFRKAGRGH